MVVSKINDIIFTLRAGAIAIHNGCVMLNKSVDGDFWFIPGGRIEEGEDSHTAIIREIKEELNQDIHVHGLVCTIENFFIENTQKYHEICFYYRVTIPEPWDGNKIIQDGKNKLEYAWLPINSINKETTYPAIIKDVISGSNTEKHIIFHNAY